MRHKNTTDVGTISSERRPVASQSEKREQRTGVRGVAQQPVGTRLDQRDPRRSTFTVKKRPSARMAYQRPGPNSLSSGSVARMPRVDHDPDHRRRRPPFPSARSPASDRTGPIFSRTANRTRRGQLSETASRWPDDARRCARFRCACRIRARPRPLRRISPRPVACEQREAHIDVRKSLALDQAAHADRRPSARRLARYSPKPKRR
jgi:hypothetical protein